MSTLTKEWLHQTIADLEEERDAVPGAVNEDAARALAAMKLALASLEAEPVSFDDLRDAVAEVSGGPAMEWSDIYKGHQAVPFINFNSLARIVDNFRAAPLATEFVPLAIHDEDFEKALSVLNDTLDDCRDSERGLLLALDKAGIEVRSDACRAAVLQGAEPVTTANKLPFDQWLSQQTGTIDAECGCVMTEVFFHWLRVAYEVGSSPVIPDGWVLVPVDMAPEQMRAVQIKSELGSYAAANLSGTYALFREFWDVAVAAAPQQEVKP
ncbi:hypothetical protein [Enterobacter hormaechei]|uniref:hypothetical protein n=1 Tax=Enterobacter hormaechei TaxID=158836 RepID=UPI002FD4ADF5